MGWDIGDLGQGVKSVGDWFWNGISGDPEGARRAAAEEAARTRAALDAIAAEQAANDPMLANYGVNGAQNWLSLSTLSGDPFVARAQADELANRSVYGALGMLQDSARNGLTSSEAANLRMLDAGMQNDVSGAARSAIQRAQQMGMGGSGAELASILSGQASAAQGAALSSGQALAEAGRRQAAAQQAWGDLSAQMQGQTFSQDAARRQAIDARAEENANRFAEMERDRAERAANLANIRRGAESTAHERGQAVYGQHKQDFATGLSNANAIRKGLGILT